MIISQQKASQLLGQALSTNPAPQNKLDSNKLKDIKVFISMIGVYLRALVIKIVYNFLHNTQKLP